VAAPISNLTAFLNFTAKDYNYADSTGVGSRPWQFGVQETFSATDGSTSATATFNAADHGNSAEWSIVSATLTKGFNAEEVDVIGVVRFSTLVPVKYEITGTMSGTTTDAQDQGSLSAGLVVGEPFNFVVHYLESDVNLGSPLAGNINGLAEGNGSTFIQNAPVGVISPGSYQIQVRFLFIDDDGDRQGTGTMVGTSRIVLTAIPEPSSLALVMLCASVSCMVHSRPPVPRRHA
jgi:hypothetical protein